MAKVHDNLILEGLSGRIGDKLVLKRTRSGRTILCKKPTFDPNRKFSAKQLARQQAFSQATEYASTMKDDPFYQATAKATARTAYNVALADWLNPPQILEVDLEDWRGAAQDLIRIRVQDDVRVVQVSLEISDEAGAVLESGQAVQGGASWWEYRVSQPLSGVLGVTVSASDLPGHVTGGKQEKLISDIR